jgi:hypothetical protein
MKIQAYQVGVEMRIGVSFHAKNKAGTAQLFFWSPDETEVFAIWTGQTWRRLPADRLPQKRRIEVTEFWANRGQRFGQIAL